MKHFVEEMWHLTQGFAVSFSPEVEILKCSKMNKTNKRHTCPTHQIRNRVPKGVSGFDDLQTTLIQQAKEV